MHSSAEVYVTYSGNQGTWQELDSEHKKIGLGVVLAFTYNIKY